MRRTIRVESTVLSGISGRTDGSCEVSLRVPSRCAHRICTTKGGLMPFPVRTQVMRASALILASSLCAQQAAMAAEEELEELTEVVVTAQFREQRLQDTPIAITAVTA